MAWKKIPLKDAGKISSGNSINAKVKAEKYTNLDDGIAYIATKDINNSYKIDYENGVKIPISEKDKFRLATKNSVLICAEGGSAGKKLGILNQDCCYVNKLFAIEPNNLFLGRYIFYWYQTIDFQNDFKSRLTGLIGGVSKKKFQEIGIPKASIEIQKRIVSILDRAFVDIEKARANAEQNINNVRELFDSYLDDYLTKKTANVSSTKLSKLCENSRGISYGVIKLGEHVEDGTPCLRTSNVRSLHIDISNYKRINKGLSQEYSRTILKGNEVLVNVRGTLGGVCSVPESMIGWNISREVAIVPLDTSKALQNFVSFWVASPSSQDWLLKVTKGAAYVGINLSDLRSLPIRLPGIEIQKEIINKIIKLKTDIENLEKKYNQKIAALDELKKSLLQKAFIGELTKEVSA